MPLNSRAKGQRGEREIVKIFVEIMAGIEVELMKSYPVGSHEIVPLLSKNIQRNHMQVDRGGFDLAGVPLLAPEVKFCETFLLNEWWQQTVRQAKSGEYPVLFYRRTRVPWRVRSWLSIQMPGVTYAPMQWTVADYDIESFIAWYALLYRGYLIDKISNHVEDEWR
jgi:hypothetical protein